MSQDVRITNLPSYKQTKTLKECNELLSSILEIKQVSAFQWLFEKGIYYMEIYLSFVDGDGDSIDSDLCNCIETHVPWGYLENAESLWIYTQLRLDIARAFNWDMLDMQSGDIYTPIHTHDLKPLYKLSSEEKKQSVPVSLLSYKIAEHTVLYRQKGVLCAKDNARKRYTSLVHLSEDKFIHTYKGGSYVSDIPGIQIREGISFHCIDEITGVGREIVKRDDNSVLLADGPLVEGYQAHVAICNLYPLNLIDILPLSPPFTWISENENKFIALVPRKDSHEKTHFDIKPATVKGTKLRISAEAVQSHPWLHGALNPEKYHLIEVDIDSRKWKPVLTQKDFLKNIYPYESGYIEFMAYSQKENCIYITDKCRVGCFELTNQNFQWITELGEDSNVYCFSMSPCGNYIAIGGIADDKYSPSSFSLIDAHTGKFIFRLPVFRTFHSAIYSITWHPDSQWLILGLANGTLIELSLDGEARYFKALKGSISHICFDQNMMYVTGNEKVIRAWQIEE
ncbi:WD40 repeat domain-containing protein [Bacillus cereus group sp. BfR-BA-01380]|uniref:WD40 repeat domain-containing protein n=1 Tax=Bacillus cereus group sp. BfR-BA-01380 TaxID=2920324 RepID=UPI001F576E7E|nr:WD40 repeat domain-containing protein [Bacillus cereus group sp. BfR-BA-01380]